MTTKAGCRLLLHGMPNNASTGGRQLSGAAGTVTQVLVNDGQTANRQLQGKNMSSFGENDAD